MLPKTDSPVPSLLFFGGPYGNLQALMDLRAIAEDLRLPPSSIVCTGDTVAYCAQPNETVEEIRRWGVQVVAGNVELQLANDAGDCGCNFIKGSVCDRLSEQWFDFANSRITVEQRDWMRSLPTTLTLLRSFDYDSEQAARLMDELNLPCEYASTLRTGLWRHMDNLPTEERAFQGVPLSFSPVLFPTLGSANAYFFEEGKVY